MNKAANKIESFFKSLKPREQTTITDFKDMTKEDKAKVLNAHLDTHGLKYRR